MLCAAVTHAQRLTPTFGPCTDMALQYVPEGLTAFSSGGKVEIAVIAQLPTAIHTYSVNVRGELIPTGSHKTSRGLRYVTHSDLDGNGTPEYVALSADRRNVVILRIAGKSLLEEVVALPSAVDRLTIADINNDGRKDILLYGRTRAGVLTLLGGGARSFVQGPVLFPDISVSDIAVADLNGDGIADVILSNWLGNQLVLFYGISKIVFSEQVALELPSEPAEIAITPVTRQRTLTIAVTMPEEQTVRVFMADAIGEIGEVSSIALHGKPSGVVITDLNDDGVLDVVTTTDKGVLVSSGVSSTRFSSPALYSTGDDVQSWIVADVDADKKPDLLVGLRSRMRLCVLANSSWSGTVQWPARFAVGRKPGGLAVRDFNGDGLPDIAVANRGSSSVSVLFNLGGGRMEGQHVVQVSEEPTHLRGISVEPVLVVSHANVDRITTVFLAEDIEQSASYSIPTGANPYVILATRNRASNFLEVLVRTIRSKDRSIGLSLFQQLREKQFLERSIKPNLPDRVLTVTVDDLTRNGEYDLVLVTHDKEARQSALSVSFGDRNFDFRTITTYSRFADSVASARTVLAGYVDGDAYKDIVIVKGPPFHMLAPLFGDGDGTFTDSLTWIGDVHLADDDNLLLRDVDGDGNVDISYLDERRNAIMTIHGRGQRRFDLPRVITSAAGVSSFRIAPMRHGNVQDLILSHASTGTVSIEFGPFK